MLATCGALAQAAASCQADAAAHLATPPAQLPSYCSARAAAAAVAALRQQRQASARCLLAMTLVLPRHLWVWARSLQLELVAQPQAMQPQPQQLPARQGPRRRLQYHPRLHRASALAQLPDRLLPLLAPLQLPAQAAVPRCRRHCQCPVRRRLPQLRRCGAVPGRQYLPDGPLLPGCLAADHLPVLAPEASQLLMTALPATGLPSMRRPPPQPAAHAAAADAPELTLRLLRVTLPRAAAGAAAAAASRLPPERPAAAALPREPAAAAPRLPAAAAQSAQTCRPAGTENTCLQRYQPTSDNFPQQNKGSSSRADWDTCVLSYMSNNDRDLAA